MAEEEATQLSEEATAVAMEEAPQEPAEPRSKFSLYVLPFVTDLQQRNGLRHEDYQRYRQYCARRLSRIHTAVHFKHGSSRKYNPKVLTAEMVTTELHLHIPLLQVERAWSYYMLLKHPFDGDIHANRKIIHARARLRKAAKFAAELQALAAATCDPRSILETTAYADWISGTVAFESHDWDQAITLLRRAKFIYEKLLSLSSVEHRVLYTARIDEIEANMRFSAFSKSGSAGMDDLLKMQHAARAGTLADELASKIDLAVAQTREQQSSAQAEIVWHGETLPVRNEKLRQHLQRARTKEFDIDQKLQSGDEKDLGGLYDELFMAYGDSGRVISDDIHAAAAEKGSKIVSQKAEMSVAVLRRLQNYFSFLKLSRMVQRTQRLLASQSLKPAERIHMYDSLLQCIAEIADLDEEQADPLSCRLAAARTAMFKGQRCYCIAESHRAQDKIAEALALYDRAVAHAVLARSHFADCEGDVADSVRQIDELLLRVRGNKCMLKATKFLQTEGVSDAGLTPPVPTKPLPDQPNTYTEDPALLRQCKLTDFPPDFQVVSCKPLFFDLANNYVAFPSLQDRVAKSAMARLKGLFWGSK
eukprot:m.230131 g.230131  ORF g.230131 m.230131 type:complete len:590 (+) comp17927_c0_seq1:37-1806(+)